VGATLLITTLNRPDELRRCVTSIARQTELPDELVVIDASDEQRRCSLDDIVEPTGIRLVHVPAERGRTRQLNTGIRIAQGDPVIIVDDDTVLDREFVHAMVDGFEKGGPDVGAIQGTMVNDTYQPAALRVLRTLFLLPQHTARSAGKVLRSGYYTIPVRPERATESEAVRLTATGFRRHVLHEFGLDEALPGYALKEDIELSYRISRRYRVLVIPEARFLHLRTPSERIDVREKARIHIVNNFWFHAKHRRGSFVDSLAFAWSLIGRVGLQLVRTVTRRNPGYILGTIDGFVDVYRRRGPRAERGPSGGVG
jgi:GT2 family glycosyltransferase